MNRRARTLAGVLTLSAMTFSSAETVFASMCAPMPEMAGMADAGAVTPHDFSAAPDCLLMSGHEGGRDPSGDGTHCPLDPAVGSGCTAVASHPSTRTAAAPSALDTFPDHATEDSGPDLLLAQSLFRPPRA